MRAAVTNGGSDGSGVINGGSDPRLGRGARAAGVNWVVPAVVWFSQSGHSGSAGLSYGGGRGNGAGRGSGQRSSGHGRGWERKMKGVKSKNPLPSSYRTSMVAEEPFSHNFAILANLAKSASPLHFKIFSLNINNIRNENYYNKN